MTTTTTPTTTEITLVRDEEIMVLALVKLNFE